MPLVTSLGRQLDNVGHIQYASYRTHQWVYVWDQLGDHGAKITCYQQSSNMTKSFYEDQVVDDIPAHVIPIDAHIRQSFT